jgi:hypothetical protein
VVPALLALKELGSPTADHAITVITITALLSVVAHSAMADPLVLDTQGCSSVQRMDTPVPWHWPRPADPVISPRTQIDHICTALISEKAAHAAPNGGSRTAAAASHPDRRFSFVRGRHV